MKASSGPDFKRLIAALGAGFLIPKVLRWQVLPHGPAVLTKSAPYANIDFENDSLQYSHGRSHRIYERLENADDEVLMKGPETIVVDPKGRLFTLTEEAKLLQISDIQQASPHNFTAKVTLMKDLGMGRPLGAKFTFDGKSLYIADAILGLTRVTNVESPTSKVELVVSKVWDPTKNKYTQILYADDVCIGKKTGKVYFTDASNIPGDRIGTSTWDTLYASKQDLLRGIGTGRVLVYDPSTDSTEILATGLKFANGIAVDEDESYLFFAETFGARLLKYHLSGPKKGEIEVMVESADMTGYPDGVDCSWKHRKCFAVLPSATVPLHKLWHKMSDHVSQFFRTLLLTIPSHLAPKVKTYGAIVEIDPSTKEFRYIQDPTGKDIRFLTGVTYHDGKLYLGSLQNDYVAVYQFD